MADEIISRVLRVYLAKCGKQWDGREAKKIVGKTVFEALADIVEIYELQCTKNELISELTSMFSDQ